MSTVFRMGVKHVYQIIVVKWNLKNNQNKTCRNGQAHDKIEEWVGVFGTSRDVLLQVIREIWDD